MWQGWITVIFFIALLALLPLALKWVQRRAGGGVMGSAVATRIVSAVGVGPHQRVVTVEVGPQGDRVWLTLGVTAQNITCLHTAPAPVGTSVAVDAPVGQLPGTLS